MTAFQTDYQSLVAVDGEQEATPENDVIYHVPPEESRWNHIEDLDSFFRRNYKFHQQGGFMCILTNELYQIIQYLFIISFSVYATHCVDFRAVPNHAAQNGTHIKLELTDLFIPLNVCTKRFSTFTWIFICVAIIVLIYYLCRTVHRLMCFHETKSFYTSALKIPCNELQNATWHEVQCKLREVQREQLMCIHKQDLSELDIYHRILRQENYMNAMMNKNIITVKFSYPFVGESIYFTPLLRFNLELLLFRSPYSPFKSTWQLKEEYKKYSNRNSLSLELSKGFLILGFLNLVCCFFIFIYQLLTACVTYAGYVQNEPAFFGSRRWSPYAMLYLRLFNELDHEFKARLNRAYKPAVSYMNSFNSHLLNIHLRNISGIFGVLALSLVIWGLLQPEIFEVIYILPILSIASFICAVGIRILPHENSVCVPETLMTRVLAELPFLPDHWKGKAHTTTIRNEFCQFFQLKITGILEHLLSAFVVPYVLIFHLRHRSLDIVDFYRSFTVEVSGVGDVCSFALMDVSKHGNYEWAGENETKADQTHQAEGGKTELSLLHFTVMNPEWQPPPASSVFINHLREHVLQDARSENQQDNALIASMNSLQSLGTYDYAAYVERLRTGLNRPFNPHSMFSSEAENSCTAPIVRGYLNQTEGPLYPNQNVVFGSVCVGSQQSGEPGHEVLNQRAAELSLNSLYLHELHHRNVQALRRRTYVASQIAHSQQEGNDESSHEQHPLLDPRGISSI